MTSSLWIFLALVALIAAAGAEAYFRRGRHRPLSQSKPEKEKARTKRKLGMEATDIDAFNKVVKENETIASRNRAIQRRK